MTPKENAAIQDLKQLVQQIKDENSTFRIGLINRVEQTEKTQVPFNLEKDILATVQSAVQTAITSSLTGYNSPLQKYATNVVERYKNQIESIFDEVVKEAISTDEFKVRVREVLLHKIAKTMISGIDGSVDKTINQMKQDTVFRSRLTLAVNGLVDEFINNKS